MTLSEYLEKYELEPSDKERFNMEAVFKKEIFSTTHECSIALFEDPETAEKSFLISTISDSSLYGEGDFYDIFLPHTQEVSILISQWLSSPNFRITKNAQALCKALNAAQKNEENELDIEEKIQSTIKHYFYRR